VKRSQVCPKCAARRIWVIEPFRLPTETAQGAVLPVVTHQQGERSGFFAIARMAPVGSFDAYLCAGCGYSELYAKDIAELREDPAQGVRLLDASTKPAGPFR
jgi:predicted nucleic-acid-binding Zn-ribbon protein